MTWLRSLAVTLLGRFGRQLRFPHLLLLTGLLLIVDLVLPDALPFVDELVLTLLTLLFASWKDGERSLENGRSGEPPEST